jgi:hypothetical protein
MSDKWEDVIVYFGRSFLILEAVVRTGLSNFSKYSCLK